MSFPKNALCALAALLLFVGTAHAGELKIACAANFTSPMKELSALYEKETGTAVGCTFGSTGMLYGQITKGAPYDLFFAADEKRPALLNEEGRAEKPVLYAKGRVVLWSSKESLASMPDWKAVAASALVGKLGIANPKTAPYGLRAQEALIETGLMAGAESKLVFGKNVGMTFQFAYSGSAEAAFVALSQALSDKGAEGKYWLLDEAGPVRQAACILNKDNSDAARFLDWLTTSEARSIISRYGYE